MLPSLEVSTTIERQKGMASVQSETGVDCFVRLLKSCSWDQWTSNVVNVYFVGYRPLNRGQAIIEEIKDIKSHFGVSER